MRLDIKRAVTLALIAVASASLAACATKKPLPVTPPPPPPPAAKPPPPPPAPVPPPPGIAPGSTQDFVVNIGDRIYFDFDAYDLRTDAQPVLANQATWLVRYTAVIIGPHTTTQKLYI